MTEQEPLQPLKPSQREALEAAVSRYEAEVTVEAARTLLDRGLTEAAVASFRLGVVGEPEPGHEKYRGWLAIPYLRADDQPLGIRFRCLQEHDHRAFGHGKYGSMTGEPTRMFNVRAIFRAAEEIHITEGELDAVILNMVGMPAVAIPGAQAFKPHYRRMLAGFSKVWLWADPDEAGGELVARVTASMRHAKPVRLTAGDVNETYLAEGAEGLYALIDREYGQEEVA